MALRKLREVIPDGQRPVSKRLELNVMSESGRTVIATVVTLE
jgi:hypothetical protein